MSRIRTVKPELFLDEDLGALPGDAALLFVGLWTVADREGRLEYRPGRLKAMLFPYREVDIPGLVSMLEACSASEQRPGKVRRYHTGGVDYLHIPAFCTHQRPHPKEAASILPEPPPWSGREITRLAVKGSHASPVVSRVLSPGEGKEIWERDLGDLAGASPAAAEQAPPRSEDHVLPALTSGREDEPASPAQQPLLAVEVAPGQANGSEAVPGKPARKPRQKPAESLEAASERRKLSDMLCAVFLELRGVAYSFDGAKDGRAVGRLLELSGGDLGEVERRWRQALGMQAGYLRAHGIAHFASAWNAYPGASATGGFKPHDRGGRATHADKDWNTYDGKPF